MQILQADLIGYLTNKGKNMPTFDLLAFARILLKYTLILAMVAYIAGLSSMLGDAIMSLWAIISSSVDALGETFNGSGSGSSLSCAFYLMHELGIDLALKSFFVSFIGLLTLWGGLVSHFVIIRVTIVFKNLLLESAK